METEIITTNTGAMIAAYFCAFLESKYPTFACGNDLDLDRWLFNSNDINTIMTGLNRLLKKGHLLKANVLSNILQKELGDITFREAYKKTGKILIVFWFFYIILGMICIL